MTSPLTDPKRTADLAAIHIAIKDLKMADADYRALLSERYGVISAAALKEEERADLLQEFERRGWAGNTTKPRDSKQVWRIKRLLKESGRKIEYGHALAVKLCKVDRLEFCRPDDLGKIIAALEYAKKRAAKRALKASGGAP